MTNSQLQEIQNKKEKPIKPPRFYKIFRIIKCLPKEQHIWHLEVPPYVHETREFTVLPFHSESKFEPFISKPAKKQFHKAAQKAKK